jgi:hypothetical protein
MDNEQNTLKFFHYIPNRTLAIVGLAVFAVAAVFLTVRIYMSKCRRFLYILPITALMECIGYLIRILCYNSTTLGEYIVMTLFLLLSPNALALVNYKALGEIIRLSNVQTTRFYVGPKFVTWFFFWSDILAFFLQASGGGLQAMSSSNMATIGMAITLVGLSVQLVFFASFGLIAIHVNRNPAYNYHVQGQTDPKGKLIRCLYITLVLLYIRAIYRVAEYAGGFSGPIASTEWAFYVFDGLVIVFSFVVYGGLFIGNYLPKQNAFEIGDDMTTVKIQSSNDLNQVESGYEMHNANNRHMTG